MSEIQIATSLVLLSALTMALILGMGPHWPKPYVRHVTSNRNGQQHKGFGEPDY